jgi:hypothetical protein
MRLEGVDESLIVAPAIDLPTGYVMLGGQYPRLKQNWYYTHGHVKQLPIIARE